MTYKLQEWVPIDGHGIWMTLRTLEDNVPEEAYREIEKLRARNPNTRYRVEEVQPPQLNLWK